MPKKPKKPLDTVSEKRPRGRPRVNPKEVAVKGDDLWLILEQNWKLIRPAFLSARSEAEFSRTWRKVPAHVRKEFPSDLLDLFAVILEIRQQRRFPKKEAKMPRFFADSLAGVVVTGNKKVGVRRSWEICTEERRRQRFQIIRRDTYIECYCSYKGLAWYGSCPRCKTDTLGEIEMLREAKLDFVRPPAPKQEV